MDIFNFNLLVNEHKMDQLLQFKRDCEEFPEGMIICGDPVDFKIISREGIIGISHMEYSGGPHSTVSIKRKSGILQSRIKQNIESVINRIEKKSLTIEIVCKEDIELLPQRLNALSEELCKLILNNIPENEEVKKLTSDLKSIIVFPEEVLSLKISMSPKKHDSEPDPDSKLKHYDIKPAVIEAMIKYYDTETINRFRQECTETWLLIVLAAEEPYAKYNICDKITEREYSSPFDRIFLYHPVKRKVLDLDRNPESKNI